MGVQLTIPNPLLELLGDRPQEVFGQELELDVEISSGVVAEGDAAAYALVWEFGNVRQTKKGPKTVLGVSLATGETVWLSTQAPQGYVRVCEPVFWRYIKQEIQKADLSGSTVGEVRESLKQMVERVAELMAQELKKTAPVDTGQLRGDIHAVGPGDPVLSEADDETAFEMAGTGE